MSLETAMRKSCRTCGSTFLIKPSEAPKRFNCSRVCSANEYKTRMLGAGNPHWKDLGKLTCATCRKEFPRIRKINPPKYCSKKCASLSTESIERMRIVGRTTHGRRKPGPQKFCKVCQNPVKNRSSITCGKLECRIVLVRAALPFRKIGKKRTGDPSKKRTSLCEYCDKEFVSRTKDNRKFCSYACFVNDGGPQRAGAAAVQMTKKYGAKKDANHDEIVAALEGIGAGVVDTSAAGGGFSDLIVMWRGETYFVEIKNPKTAYGRRGLNPLQKRFAEKTALGGVTVHVVKSVDEALAVFGARRAA